MHPRKEIRQAVVELIAGASTIAQDRVWGGQQPPVDVKTVLVEEGPVILVYTRHDRVAHDGYPASGEGAVKRECELCIEILAAGNFAVDDKIDDVAEEVEPIVDGFEVPALPATEIRYRETTIESTDQFAKPVAGAFLTYDVTYWKDRRTYPEEEIPGCPTDVGVVFNGGPRQALDIDCDCPEDPAP